MSVGPPIPIPVERTSETRPGPGLTSIPMTAHPKYDPSDFPPFAVTADLAVLTTQDGSLQIVLVQRGSDPYKGRWALPGGFVDIDEDLEPAAIRELHEETGLTVNEVAQLGAYGDPDRDPRMRVVTVVFWTHIDDVPPPAGDDDAADARLWDIEEILADPDLVAFDHHQIIGDVVATYRGTG